MMSAELKALLLAVFSLFVAQCAVAQSVTQVATDASQGGWQFETESHNDAPYIAIRLRITQEVATSRTPFAIIDHYRTDAQREPTSAIAAFSLAVASLSELTRVTNDSQAEQCVQGVKEALAHANSPRTYEYTRMRFIFEAYDNYADPSLISVADRLLIVNKNDPVVLRIAALCNSLNMPKATRMMGLAISLSPTDEHGYFTLGRLYLAAYQDTHKVQYAMSGIAALRRFLELSPQQSDSRTWAINVIADFRQQLAARTRKQP